MQNLFRRWFGGARGAVDLLAADTRAWAQTHDHRFVHSRGATGFVIDSGGGHDAGFPWRVEWGPSQRDYIVGSELRVRAEIGGAGDLQMLVITRGLVKQLEAEVFDQYTEGNKTRIDDRTPEEMRWLVLYPMLPRSVLGALRERFAALSNVPAASAQWIEGALAEQLAASSRWLDGDTPLAMVVQRSRFVLRVEAAQPSAALVQAAVELGVVAAAAARRVADEVARGVMGSGRPSHWGAPSAMPPQRNESS